MPKAIQINWQFAGGVGTMQVEHTADCFGGAWLKSPLSTEVWHPRHIWRETAFQFAEVKALNGETVCVCVTEWRDYWICYSYVLLSLLCQHQSWSLALPPTTTQKLQSQSVPVRRSCLTSCLTSNSWDIIYWSSKLSLVVKIQLMAHNSGVFCKPIKQVSYSLGKTGKSQGIWLVRER